MRERQRRRHYLKKMKVQRELEAQYRQAMGMLLGAEWKGHYFKKSARGVSENGIPFHWTTFYDANGAEISASQALMLDASNGKAKIHD